MGEPAILLSEELASEAAVQQTARLIVIQGGKGVAAESAAAVATEVTAVETVAIGDALLSCLAPLAVLAILLWPSSIAPEPPMPARHPAPDPPKAPSESPVQICVSPQVQSEAPRNANQTCSNEELSALQAQKDERVRQIPPRHAMDTGNPKKALRIPCSYIRARLAHIRRLRSKRQEIQDLCFGGKPDASHSKAIQELGNSIKYYEALQNINCASGHPMEKS